MLDADVRYLPCVELQADCDVVLRRLVEATPWRSDTVKIFGKTYLQPRLTAWVGDDGKNYRYSGLDLVPLPWSEELLGIKRRVEAAVGTTFNSVLLNYYRGHRDSMGLHSDDEAELGASPVIAALTLGAERMLVFKHKTRRDLRRIQLPLASGSLLLMQGDTQRYWKHGMDKLSHPCGPRVSLTFRRIVAYRRLKRNES